MDSNSNTTNAARRLDSIEEEPLEEDRTKTKPKVPPKPKMIQAPNGRLKPVPPPRPTKT